MTPSDVESARDDLAPVCSGSEGETSARELEPAPDELAWAVTPWRLFFVFAALALILGLLRVLLVADGRVPLGHDAWQYMHMQYVLFFNEPIQHADIPLWLPYMTHGTISNLWILITQGLLVSVLSPWAEHLSSVNFVYLYQVGLYFDELVFLLGCTLLSGLCFRRISTVFFVCTSLSLANASSVQVWWDFHIIYLFPLTLYCLYRALTQCSAKYLFFASILAVGGFLANLPYNAVVLAFITAVFAACIFVAKPVDTLAVIRRFLRSLGFRHALALVLPTLLLACVFLWLQDNLHSLVNHNEGRVGWATSSMTEFLSYGGSVKMARYFEFIARYSNSTDNTIYAGLLLIPFAYTALTGKIQREALAFATAAFLILLFSSAGFVSVAYFYLMPFGTLFRHIGLTAPFVKFFVVFLAGYGFERYWHARRTSTGYASQTTPRIVAAPIRALAAIAVVLALKLSDVIPLYGYQLLQTPPRRYLNQLYVTHEPLVFVVGLLIILAITYMIILAVAKRNREQLPFFLVLILTLHLGDLISLKYEREFLRVPRSDAAVEDLFAPYAYAFPERRGQAYLANARFAAIAHQTIYPDELPTIGQEPALLGPYMALYWSLDSFTYLDASACPFRVDHWLQAIDSLHRVWVAEKRVIERHLPFPRPTHKAYGRLSGVTEPKLAVFSKAHAFGDEEAVTAAMADENFAGHAVYVNTADAEVLRASGVVLEAGAPNPDADDRVRSAQIEVVSFSCNTLEAVVSNPNSGQAILYYADGYHPEWAAEVDGTPTEVVRASLGYKAIAVPPGRSEIRFQFGGVRRRMLLIGLLALSHLSMLVIVALALSEWRTVCGTARP